MSFSYTCKFNKGGGRISAPFCKDRSRRPPLMEKNFPCVFQGGKVVSIPKTKGWVHVPALNFACECLQLDEVSNPTPRTVVLGTPVRHKTCMTIPSTTRVKLEQGSRHKRTLNGVKAIVLRFQKLQFHPSCEGHAHLRKRNHASSRHGEDIEQTKDWKTTTKRHIKTQKISTRLRFTVASSRRLGSFPPFHVEKMRFKTTTHNVDHSQADRLSGPGLLRRHKEALNTASTKITFDSAGLELSDFDSL
jgi:hypothetical protein